MHSRDGSLAGGETDEHLYKSSSAEVVPNVSFQDSYVSKYFLKKGLYLMFVTNTIVLLFQCKYG